MIGWVLGDEGHAGVCLWGGGAGGLAIRPLAGRVCVYCM